MQSLNNQVLKNKTIATQGQIRKIVTQIKEKQAPTPTEIRTDETDPIVLAKQRADREIERMKREAKTEALKQAEEIKEQARQEGFLEGQRTGYDQGHKEGLAAAKEEAHQMIKEAQEMKTQAECDIESFKQQARQEVVAFSIALAEKLTLAKITTDEATLAHMIAQPIDRLEQANDAIIIKVHPTAVAPVTMYMQNNQEKWAHKKIQVLSDPTLEQSDYCIDTDDQVIHFELKQALERVQTRLLEIEGQHNEDDLS